MKESFEIVCSCNLILSIKECYQNSWEKRGIEDNADVTVVNAVQLLLY